MTKSVEIESIILNSKCVDIMMDMNNNNNNNTYNNNDRKLHSISHGQTYDNKRNKNRHDKKNIYRNYSPRNNKEFYSDNGMFCNIKQENKTC